MGDVVHSGRIKEIYRNNYKKGDKVLVYGGGETASDIVDASIIYVGFARPAILSLPMMVDMQCKYVFSILSGEKQLPNNHQMHEIALSEFTSRKKYFNNTRTPQGFVCAYSYLLDLNPALKFCPKNIGLIIFP